MEQHGQTYCTIRIVLRHGLKAWHRSTRAYSPCSKWCSHLSIATIMLGTQM